MPLELSNPGLFVGGEWVDAPRREAVLNPYSGATIAQVPVGDAAMLDRAADAAQQAFAVTRKLAGHEKAKILNTAAAEMQRRAKEFAELIVAEAGKPITLAEGEVSRCVMTLTIAAEEARRVPGEILSLDALPAGQNHFGLARRFPIGPIYGITPFNFPLNLVAHKVAPAIASGNTIVIKPAPKTPLSSLLLADVLSSAGLTAGALNVVTCPNDLAGRLVQNERIKMVSFTGSPAVGWPIKSSAGKKKVTLELGGNAAIIVHEDADLETAIPIIATGAFAYAGQSCISVQRIFVHRTVYQQFVEKLVTYTNNKILAGDPTRRDVLVGPMINAAALQRTSAMIAQARSAGARVLCGGEVSADGKCFQPTLLTDANPKLDVCATEAFAPIAVIAAYDLFDEAIALVNDSPFGLQCGVFTRDLYRSLHAFSELEVGAVMINQVPTWRVEHMPYGGVKDSGFGREGLRYAIEEMTELRSLVVRM